MNAEMLGAETWRRDRWEHTKSLLAGVAPPTVVAMPLVEWIPGVPDSWRPWLVVTLAVVALGGYIAGRVLQRDERLARGTLESDLNRARKMLDSVEPRQLMMQIAAELFLRGSWRLAVYEKLGDPEVGEQLALLYAVSSDGVYEKRVPSVINIRKSLFGEVFSENLAFSRYRQAFQSGAFDEDTATPDWERWRQEIFGGSEAIGVERSAMRARKFAWYATQDPDHGNNVVAIAESANSSGVNFEFFDSISTSIWLTMIARMSVAKRGLQPAIDGAQGFLASHRAMPQDGGAHRAE